MEPGTSTRPWLAVFLTALALFAAGPSARPSPPPPPSYFVLDNGLRVRLRPLPSASQSNLFLLFTGGSDLDPPGTSDGVHLLEHLFLYAGTSTRPARERPWDYRSRDLGLSGETGRDSMIIRWTCPPGRLYEEMAEVAERFRSLRLDDGTWNQERAAVLRQIRESPPSRTREEKYARLTMEDVRALEAYLLRPDRAILCVSGPFDPDVAEKKVRDTFGSIPRPSDSYAVPPRHAGWFPRPVLSTEFAPRNSWSKVGIRVSFRSPGPWSLEFPAFLVAAARLSTATSKGVPWTLEWPEPLTTGEFILRAYLEDDETGEEAWTRIREHVAKVLLPPPDEAELLRAQKFARDFLGVDDWFASLDAESMKAAANLEVQAIWREVDRETIVERMLAVSPEGWGLSLRHWTDPASTAAVATLPPPATEWETLGNGLRVGVHPLSRSSRTGVAFLLPFGRDNGPSPVIARLFAHGLTPGRDVSHWTVRSALDCTVLWWEGDQDHLDHVLRDLTARLQGLAPSEEDLALEKAALAEPDPYPEPKVPASMSTALLEGARSVSGRPREEAPAPASAAEAADQITAWCTIRSARVVVAGPVDVPDVMARIRTSLATLPSPGVAPPAPAKEPLAPFSGMAPDAQGVVCQAYALPPTASEGEFVPWVAAALRHESEFRAPQSGRRLPEATFDFLMDPGVIVFTTPLGRRPDPPEWRFDWVNHKSSYPPGGNARRILGSGLGAGRSGSSSWRYSDPTHSFARAVRAALLDFRAVDATGLGRSLEKLTPESVTTAGKELRKTPPVEFRVRIDTEE